jgi:hypothetical protein
MPILGIIASSRLVVVPNSYESIATVTVGSGGAANIEFTSIPATYTHLQVRGIGRSLEANTGVDVQYLRFNSDTGSNYAWHQLFGSGGSASAAAGTSTSFMRGGLIALDSEPANVFGAVIIDILDYKNTNKYKTVKILSGTEYNNTRGGISISSGLWQNTNAVTTITLQPSTANFAQYTQFALYGIKGA